jgi:hypothetical protein
MIAQWKTRVACWQNSGTVGEIGICSGESKLQKTEGALQALTTE